MAELTMPLTAGTALESPNRRSLWKRLCGLSPIVLKRKSCTKRGAQTPNFKPKPPKMDLVTWTLGDDSVPKHKTIFADASHSESNLSRGQVISLVRRLVGGFYAENGGSHLNGDVVCVHAFNSIFYPVLFHGILGAGGCFTGTNPAYTETELEHHFRQSNTKFVISISSHIDNVLLAAHECGIPESRIFVLEYEDMLQYVKEALSSGERKTPVDSAHPSPPGSPRLSRLNLQSCNELLKHGEVDWISFTGLKRSAATPAALFSTSGTSGLPKLAVRTHANLIAECEAIKDHGTKPYEQIRLLSVPFFHAFASPLANILSLRDGVTTYIQSRFNEVEFLEAVERYHVTESALVPPIILRFLLNCSERVREQLSSLRTVWCGGAPLDAQTQIKAESDLLRPDARIAQVWGLTECGWVSTFHYPEKDTTGSVGRILPGYRVRIIDEKDCDVWSGCGEIAVKSLTTMEGYLNDDSATEKAFAKDRWYRTGDIGHVRDGKIYIVDRKKELIKVRGWQVAPAELEGTLVQHSAVVDAAVIGVPAEPESTEEVPEAYVVRAPGSNLSEEEVKGYLLQFLAKYKVLDCHIIFTDSIPKSASGKILRKLLRERRKQSA